MPEAEIALFFFLFGTYCEAFCKIPLTGGGSISKQGNGKIDGLALCAVVLV